MAASKAQAGQIGGLVSAGRNDMHERAGQGQRGLRAKFYRETPDSLPETERWKRADLLLKAHLARIRVLANAARQRGGTKAGPGIPETKRGRRAVNTSAT